MASDVPLLQVEDLRIQFPTDAGIVRAVDGASFSVEAGEAVGLVGESGSGKSVAALALADLVPSPPAVRISGRVRWKGRDVAAMDREALRSLRGGGIGYVFQEPGAALDPVFTIGDQVAETVRAHATVSRAEARRRATDLLRRVGFPDAESRRRDHPHQLSGGQRQRAMLAVALAGEPELLVADEPTTALDVTVQARILDLFAAVRRRHRVALLLITHDLDVVAEVVERVLVMAAGRVVEQARVADLFASPLHPYTRGLLESRPRLSGPRRERLGAIPGAFAGPGQEIEGCRFRPRCAHAEDRCRTADPSLEPAGDGRAVACLRWRELA